MPRCLNPKKAHQNRDALPRSNPSGATAALAESSTTGTEEPEGEQIACQFCKYLLDGAILGDSRIIRWIGSGAFGDVYEAEQLPPLSRRVAIKVMSMERVVDGQSAAMFAREVSTIAALDHPNILPVLRVGTIEDGRPYLVMKYAAQGSLQKFCQPGAPLLSLLPTVVQPEAINTPTDALAIVAADTLKVSQAIAEQAQSAQLSSTDEPESGETGIEQTERRRPGNEKRSASETNAEAEQEELNLLTRQEGGSTAEAKADEHKHQEEQAIDKETQQTVQVLIAAREEIATAEANEQEKAVDDISQEQTVLNGLPEGEHGAFTGPEVAQIATVLLTGNGQIATAQLMTPPQSAIKEAALSPQQLLSYVEESAAALQYAHDHGLIHLDVKPANLLLDAQGRLMLADFGVSVLLEGYTHASLHCYVGTPLYTAPEQWLEQPRAASDQYALAITCYQLLAGRAPFTGNLYAVMHGHLQAQPPAMSEFNPLISEPIERVIQRALAKDPNERYPNMLAFAQAYREALENAASAETDSGVQHRVPLLPAPQAETRQAPLPVTPLLSSNIERIEETPLERVQLSQVGTFKEPAPEMGEQEASDQQRRTTHHPWLRNLVLLLLTFLLIASGSLGFVRAERPCWLGICAQIMLSTNSVNLTNDAAQTIKMTNTGTADLEWQGSITAAHTYPWLTLSPTSGVLHPGTSGILTIKTNVDSISNSEIIDDPIQISGSMGVVPQTILVRETVVKGLATVSVNASGTSFLYAQSHLQPDSQNISITNKSGHTLNWFTEESDNNWLQVTPGQGSLPDNKSVDLTVTVANPQNLPTDQYQADFSLFGQLDNQAQPLPMQTIHFNLQVSQSKTVPTATPPSPTPQDQIPFAASLINGLDAPAGPRTAHSMVWDSQDSQLLVFGGIDNQGNLLNDLWSYRPDSNKWTNLTPDNPATTDCSSASSPAPRMNAAMVWDSVNQQILLYGGQGEASSYLGDLWSYSPATGNWTSLACTGNGPGERAGAGVAWDGSHLLILGGINSGKLLSDFWSYTPGNGGSWNQLYTTTPLAARAYPTMSWDTNDEQLYIFGGQQANGQQGKDFYVYQPGTGWKTINASSSNNPAPRQQAMSTWDSADNVFLLLGGWEDNNETTYSSLWAYSPAKNEWIEIQSLQSSSATSIIASRSGSVMVWDSASNRAYIYAGAGSENKATLGDLWMITPG